MMTSSPGETLARMACQMDCLAPLLTTTSLGLYSKLFSSLSLWQMACRSLAVPVLGV